MCRAGRSLEPLQSHHGRAMDFRVFAAAPVRVLLLEGWAAGLAVLVHVAVDGVRQWQVGTTGA
jgi:hypothetical protein